MVDWTAQAYEEMEEEREIAEATEGKRSIFEWAFLHTGALVTASGTNDINDEINPEGVATALENVNGRYHEYYQEHGIKKFRDFIACADKPCSHANARRRMPEPTILPAEIASDSAVSLLRINELTDSDDPRARLIVQCVEAGFIWAGSSFIVWYGTGLKGLIAFLSEVDGNGIPAHDIDLYRTHKKAQLLGIRFVGKIEWMAV